MKTFQIRNQNVRGPVQQNFKFFGSGLIDAIKNNFQEILDASTYYSKPFEYPITVVITPPDHNLVRVGKPQVRVDLEWMWATHQDRPKTKHTHFFYIQVDDEADIPEKVETFVILGN